MKKIFTVMALAAFTVAASAQTKVYDESKFFDNWSLGLEGGVVTPTTGHAFWGDCRGVFGLNLTKQISPVFGLQFEGTARVNTFCSDVTRANKPSHTNTLDALTVGVNGNINLMNLFAGYNGKPRVFEIEGVVGLGWAHYFNPSCESKDWNTMYSKFGLNFNFNLGKERAWTINVKPAISYGLVGEFKQADCGYNVNRSNIELLAGVTYHFKNSNGKHHFTLGRAYDQAEVDGLNANINSLRSQLSDRDQQLANKDAIIRQLQNDLDDCRNRKPTVETKVVTETKTNEVPAFNIIFDLGKSTIDASQLKNVKLMGQYLKKHPEATVDIKGYASTDGNADRNIQLAKDRANSVKKYLMQNYGISESRINAQGMGATESFGEPELNRIDVCVVEAK